MKISLISPHANWSQSLSKSLLDQFLTFKIWGTKVESPPKWYKRLKFLDSDSDKKALMSSTITIPTCVTCTENVKIASLGQNHFFTSILNSHLLLQLIYFKLFYFCHIWFKFVFTHNPLWVWSFSQIINFEFTDTVKSRNNNILYYMEASISLVRSTGTLKTDFLPLFTTWRSHHHFSLGNSALFLRFFSLYFRFLSLFFSCFFLLHSLILASFSSFSLTIPLVKRTCRDRKRVVLPFYVTCMNWLRNAWL